jgi:hypothetical protein
LARLQQVLDANEAGNAGDDDFDDEAVAPTFMSRSVLRPR